MTNEPQVKKPDTNADGLYELLAQGDMAKLSTEHRVHYLRSVCESLGLNPLTQPIKFMALSGKVVPYATAECAAQLRKIHNISVAIVDRAKREDLLVVTARATLPDGRFDESIAALDLTGLAGERLANQLMKCETKAKRRVTLSIVGLSMLDETEVETVQASEARGADRVATIVRQTQEVVEADEPKQLAEPVKQAFRYDLAALADETKRRLAEHHLSAIGATIDNSTGHWVAPIEVPKLVNYKVTGAA